MQIVCVSRGTLSRGDELAELLASKLGYACVSREDLMEAASQEGIQVGKLESAMVKPWTFTEQLDVQREHYLAFTTAYLCDRALEEGLVYQGRTGHLLLPSIAHVLSVRVVADEEERIARVMMEHGLGVRKARRYVRDLDNDQRQWARSMYGVDWEDAAHYDLVVNMAHMNVETAASALAVVAHYPDFQMTPASRQAMLDLRLAAKCRVALSKHDKTFRAKFTVRSDGGVVTVTHQPQDARCAKYIPDALAPVADVVEVHSTMAMTNILWIQQRFDPNSDVFHEVVELATKWNAAVELIRLAPDRGTRYDAPEQQHTDHSLSDATPGNGLAEEDVGDLFSDDGGVQSTLDMLAKEGRSGGGTIVYGETAALIECLDRSRSYSLIVAGDLFLDRDRAT